MRRANGTGSIVKLSGNRRRPYLVKISARDKDGYVRQVALSYHAKLQEAQEALEEYNRKAAAGQTPGADMLSWTVEQVYAAWSEREYPRSGKSSVASHKASWNQRISRYAARKMRSVTLDECTFTEALLNWIPPIGWLNAIELTRFVQPEKIEIDANERGPLPVQHQ